MELGAEEEKWGRKGGRKLEIAKYNNFMVMTLDGVDGRLG